MFDTYNFHSCTVTIFIHVPFQKQTRRYGNKRFSDGKKITWYDLREITILG